MAFLPSYSPQKDCFNHSCLYSCASRKGCTRVHALGNLVTVEDTSPLEAFLPGFVLVEAYVVRNKKVEESYFACRNGITTSTRRPLTLGALGTLLRDFGIESLQPHEQLMFHGTKHAHLLGIIDHGFDVRKTLSGLFFAQNASVSHEYTDRNEEAVRAMFIARVNSTKATSVRGHTVFLTSEPC